MKRYIVHLISLMFMITFNILPVLKNNLTTQNRHTINQFSGISHISQHSPLLLHKSINRSYSHFDRLHRYYHVLYSQAQQCHTDQEKVLMHLNCNPFLAASCFYNHYTTIDDSNDIMPIITTTQITPETISNILEIIAQLEEEVLNLLNINQLLHNIDTLISTTTALLHTIESYLNINNLLKEVNDILGQVGNIVTTIIVDTQETIQSTLDNLINVAQITTIDNLLNIAQSLPQTSNQLLNDITHLTDDLVSDAVVTTDNLINSVTHITDNLIHDTTQTIDIVLPEQTIDTIYQQIETVINNTTITLLNAPTIITALLQSALFRISQLQYPEAIQLLQKATTTNLMLVYNQATDENLHLQAYLQKLLGDTYSLNAELLTTSNYTIEAITEYQLAAQTYTLAGKLYETIAQYPLATQAFSLAEQLFETINL